MEEAESTIANVEDSTANMADENKQLTQWVDKNPKQMEKLYIGWKVNKQGMLWVWIFRKILLLGMLLKHSSEEHLQPTVHGEQGK